MNTNTSKLLNCVFNRTRRTQHELHIMKFLTYNPWIKDRKTLIDEFKFACKIAGKNNIDQMAQIMYDDQTDVLENRSIPLEDCRSFIEDLFITKSIKGHQMEKEAITWLNMTCDTDYNWQKADDHLDTKYNVDICGRKGDKVIYIQVKPENYRNCDDSIKAINDAKEKRLGNKIHYLYYDMKGRFSV